MLNGNSPLRDDEFVYHVVKDPSDPPDTLLLVGFVGKSENVDCVRVYMDVMLAAYVDIPKSAVLHGQRIPESQSPLGGWYVWVKRDLDLVDTIRNAYAKLAEVQEEYMQNLKPEADSFGDMSPGWPQLPT